MGMRDGGVKLISGVVPGGDPGGIAGGVLGGVPGDDLPPEKDISDGLWMNGFVG